MSEDDVIEQTESSRYRKLVLCLAALVAVHHTQVHNQGGITWPVVVVDSIIVLSYVSSDVLVKVIKSEAFAKAKAVIASKIPTIEVKKKDK